MHSELKFKAQEALYKELDKKLREVFRKVTEELTYEEFYGFIQMGKAIDDPNKQLCAEIITIINKTPKNQVIHDSELGLVAQELLWHHEESLKDREG